MRVPAQAPITNSRRRSENLLLRRGLQPFRIRCDTLRHLVDAICTPLACLPHVALARIGKGVHNVQQTPTPLRLLTPLSPALLTIPKGEHSAHNHRRDGECVSLCVRSYTSFTSDGSRALLPRAAEGKTRASDTTEHGTTEDNTSGRSNTNMEITECTSPPLLLLTFILWL